MHRIILLDNHNFSLHACISNRYVDRTNKVKRETTLGLDLHSVSSKGVIHGFFLLRWYHRCTGCYLATCA
jgi:hypothetical protein